MKAPSSIKYAEDPIENYSIQDQTSPRGNRTLRILSPKRKNVYFYYFNCNVFERFKLLV